MDLFERRSYAIVCPFERKDDFLRMRSKTPTLDFSLFTKEEVLSLFGFQKDLRAVSFLMKNGYSYSLSIDILEAFCAPFFERSKSGKLLPLFPLRDELIEKGYLWRYPNVERMFMDKHVLLCDYGEASSLSECLSSCSGKMMIDFELKERKAPPSYYLSFKNVYEELHYVLNEIAHDIDCGISPEDIYIYGASEEHYPYLKDLAPLYGLSIDLSSSCRLFDHPAYRLFAEQFLANSFDIAISLLKESYPEMDLDAFERDAAYFGLEFEDKKTALAIFDELAKRLFVSTPKRKNAIRLLKEAVAPKNSRIYAIHFAMGTYPRVHREVGYLSDSERSEIGLLNGLQKTIDEASFLKGFLESGSIALLTFKERAFGSSFFPSGYSSTFGIEKRNPPFQAYEYSKKKGEYLLSMLLDKKANFDEDDERILPLEQIASPSFRTYDYRVKSPIVTGRSETISLSQGSFETYLNCPFKYYCDSLLGLARDVHSWAIDVGLFFHKVLELHYADSLKGHDALYEETYSELGPFDERETFLLEHLRPYSKKNVEFYEELDPYFPSLVVFSEGSFDLPLDEKTHIRGRYDKIGTFQSEGNYLFIVDYKSGAKRFDPVLFENYKLNPQLPFYAYYAKREPRYASFSIAGLFISPLLSLEISEEKKDVYSKADRNAMKLTGLYLDEAPLWGRIGTWEKNGYSDYFAGMRMSKEKGLSGNACSYSEEKIEKMCKCLSDSLLDVAEKIREGRFDIAPLYINGCNDPCELCDYRDICYRKKRDFPLLTKQKEVGFETDEREEDGDGLDE